MGVGGSSSSDGLNCSTGERGAWGFGPPTSDGMPSQFRRRPNGVLCVAHGLTNAPALNGRRCVKVDAAREGRCVVDFGQPYGQKAVKDEKLRELAPSEGAPELSVSPSGVVVSQDGIMLQRMSLGDISRILSVDGRDGTEHVLLRGFEDRRSMYLLLDQSGGLPEKLFETMRRLGKQQVERLPFWHCGGDASFATRLRNANCRFPQRADGQIVERWWASRSAVVFVLICMRNPPGCLYHLPSDCVLGVLACFGWAEGAATVRADGLNGATELNGRRCRVCDVKDDRLVVAFGCGAPDPQLKSLSPGNLRRRRLDGLWIEADEWPAWCLDGKGQWELTGRQWRRARGGGQRFELVATG
eukprot:TRINITY_DN33244_c0_g1_i1.p2 TRINITY_DN33244_c0_g1~~TRINITY_DN33244_c0_g1_i1.p2  ORF type:complete len:357 (+),score=124.61 TRINITY_DN33244_c0_g1_i1:119-1189(+)